MADKTAQNPYGLNDGEIAQIDAMAAAANKPNINLMAGMIAGDPQTANMASQVQAQQFKGGQQRVAGLRGALQQRATSRDVQQRQGVLQAARTGAAKDAALLERQQDESDYTRDRKDEVADLEFKRQQAMDLAELRNQRMVSQTEKAKARLKRDENRYRMRHHKTQQPKALSNSEMTSLNDGDKMINLMEDLQGRFKDSYVTPEAGVLGRLGNLASQEFGMFTSPETDERAAWWEDYKRFVELIERHEMFGATLTRGENQSWKQAEINIGQKADKNRANFVRRIKRLKEVLDEYATGVTISRKAPMAVEALVRSSLGKDWKVDKDLYYEPFPEDLLVGGAEAPGYEEMSDDDLRQKMIDAGLDPAEHGL
jgi:hypothetical protein